MRIYLYYRVRPPVEGAEIVEQQLRLGCLYQKVLVYIERDRRVAIEQIYRDAAPEAYAAFCDATAAVRAAIEATRGSRATILPPNERRETTGAAKDALAIAREAENHARQAWYDARKKATPTIKAQIKARDAEAYAKKKVAYNAAGSAGKAQGAVLLLAGCIEQKHELLELAWGTRLMIDQFVEQAAGAAIKEGYWLIGDLANTKEARRELQGSLPQVPHFDGGGTIAVQLQGAGAVETSEVEVAPRNGLTYAAACGGKDTRFRLDVADHGTWQMLQGSSAFTSTKKDGRVVELPQRGEDPRARAKDPAVRALAVDRSASKRGAEHERGLTIARLRVGSNGRAPIWAAWPVHLHRDLPADAPIKWVQMHACKVGPRTEWNLLVTVDDTQPPLRDELTLAVNIGWRNLPNGGIRVAYAVGSDGYEEEIRVPTAYVRGVAHVESLMAIRKRLFNAAIKMLDDWIDEGERPAWLLEAARYRDRWLAQRKFVMFLAMWEKNRFTGDAKMFDIFAKWCKKDRHLWMWESDERLKLLRMRKDFYRVVAVRWAARYIHIFITDMDLRDFAEKESPEAADASGKVQRITQKMAAPSELRGAIENASSTRGVCCPRLVQRNRKQVVEGSCTRHRPFAETLIGKNATIICNTCRAVVRFDARRTIMNTCNKCRSTWDQDANHCRNLLASGQVVSSQAGPLASSGSVPVSEPPLRKGRWARRRSQTAAQSAETIDVSE